MVLGRQLALPCQWRSGEAKQTRGSDERERAESLGMSLSGGEEVRLKLGLTGPNSIRIEFRNG